MGERVTPLVDGELAPDVAGRAYAHVAVCTSCREALDLERLTKGRLATLPPAVPDDDLVAALLRIGGPEGPLPPREGHVPGSARPVTAAIDSGPPRSGRRPAGAAPGRSPDGGADGRRPGSVSGSRRRSTRRMTAAVVGAFTILGLGVVGVGAQSATGPAFVPPVDSFVVQHATTTRDLPFSEQLGWSLGGEGDR